MILDLFKYRAKVDAQDMLRDIFGPQVFEAAASSADPSTQPTPGLASAPLLSSTRVRDLSRNWWLHVECRCRRSKGWRCRQLAEWYGRDMPLGAIAARARCRNCRMPPTVAWVEEAPDDLSQAEPSNAHHPLLLLPPVP
jgi:hypothetical protein